MKQYNNNTESIKKTFIHKVIHIVLFVVFLTLKNKLNILYGILVAFDILVEVSYLNVVLYSKICSHFKCRVSILNIL